MGMKEKEWWGIKRRGVGDQEKRGRVLMIGVYPPYQKLRNIYICVHCSMQCCLLASWDIKEGRRGGEPRGMRGCYGD